MSRVLRLCVCTLAILGGCQSRPEHASAVPALSTEWLAEVGDWPGPELDLIQLVRFTDHHNDTIHLLRFDIALSGDRLLLSAQATSGIPLYRLTLTRGELTIVRQPAAPDQIPVESALADFLLATWPLAALEPALAKSGYTIEAGGDQRRLKSRTGVVLVEFRGLPPDIGQPVQITHHDIPLEISIQTLERRTPSSPPGAGMRPGAHAGAPMEDPRHP
jgi:hypothetical protein